MRALIALSLLVSSAPALAQEAKFQPEDAKSMVQCLDAAAAYAAEAELDPQSSVPAGTLDDPHRPADCIGAASNPCMETPEGYTTIGMSDCLTRETDWWDSQLNADFDSLRAELDDESFEALQAAQRSWIDWRDSKCEFEYTFWRDGTIRSTVFGSCMLDVTAQRAIDLKSYLGWMS